MKAQGKEVPVTPYGADRYNFILRSSQLNCETLNALVYACMHSHIEAANLLLEKGARI
jgi:ankyrin repeat protein